MLDRTALLSYLKSICDLEKNIPIAEETKKELINESEKLGISRVVKEEPKKIVWKKKYYRNHSHLVFQ